jgi:hypothetical protein
MRSIVIFKLSRNAPVSAMFNIQARGTRHSETLAMRYADQNGFNYWHIKFDQARDDMATLGQAKKWPFFKVTG